MRQKVCHFVCQKRLCQKSHRSWKEGVPKNLTHRFKSDTPQNPNKIRGFEAFCAISINIYKKYIVLINNIYIVCESFVQKFVANWHTTRKGGLEWIFSK